ncbi:MAG: YraN family protein [Comamonas sp.]|nr:YraN family protein [Candidatus Comamonas equi]
MLFLGKKPKPVPPVSPATTTARGQAGEDQALAYLQARGLRLLGRNYRTPGRGGGEIDLILQESDGTVVFVEVRSRSYQDFGGAGASIVYAKRQRIVRAARQWLHAKGWQVPCRFDVVLIQGAQLQWLQAAFDAA